MTGVPVVPGTDGPVTTSEQVKQFCQEHGMPIILKAAYGGGGRGMRVVRRMEVRDRMYCKCYQGLNIVGIKIYGERLVCNCG